MGRAREVLVTVLRVTGRVLLMLVPRFSLRTLVLLMLIVTCVLGLRHRWSPWGVRFTLEAEKSAIASAHFSPDGAEIVTCHDDGWARLWSTRDGSLVREFDHGGESVVHAVFSPRGELLLTVCRVYMAQDAPRALISLWEIPTGHKIAEFFGAATAPAVAAFSPLGTHVVTPDDDPAVLRLRESRTGRSVLTFEGHEGAVWMAGFSPDGRHLVTTCLGGAPRVWSVVTGEPVKALDAGGMGVPAVAFSPDGDFLAAGCFDGRARIWSTRGWKLWAELEGGLPLARGRDLGRSESVLLVSFSLDGSRLLTWGGEGTTRIWKTRSARLVREFDGGMGPPPTLSPDGSRLATVDSDGGVKVWGAESGIPLADIAGGPALHLLERFSPDGKMIVASAPGTPQRRALAVYERRRDEDPLSFLWLPDFWLAVVFTLLLLWSFSSDRRRLGRPAAAASGEAEEGPGSEEPDPAGEG